MDEYSFLITVALLIIILAVTSYGAYCLFTMRKIYLHAFLSSFVIFSLFGIAILYIILLLFYLTL